MPKQTTESIRGQVVGMWRAKVRQVDIDRTVGIAQSNVSRIIQKFEKTESVSRRKGSGRRRITTARTDCQLVQMAKKDRKRPAASIQTEVFGIIDHQISRETINKRLIAVDYPARRPLWKPKLKVSQKKNRRNWAEPYRTWTDRQWSRVVFTDESSFELLRIDR